MPDAAQGLTLWVVYEHPKDFPDEFVARRFVGDSATSDVLRAPTLAKLRAQLPPDLIYLPRDPSDDPVIVESWI